MRETVQIPVSLLGKMAEAAEAFHELEEELEDFLISRNGELLSRLENARRHHRIREVRPFSEIRGSA